MGILSVRKGWIYGRKNILHEKKNVYSHSNDGFAVLTYSGLPPKFLYSFKIPKKQLTLLGCANQK